MQVNMKAVLISLRPSKNDSNKNYADFAFIGGSISLPVDPSDLSSYAGREGTEMDIAVSVRPRSVVMFGRPVTLFEPVGLQKNVKK